MTEEKKTLASPREVVDAALRAVEHCADKKALCDDCTKAAQAVVDAATKCEIAPDCNRPAEGTLRLGGTTYASCRECVGEGFEDRFTPYTPIPASPGEVVNLDAVPDPTMPEEAADRAVGYCRHVKADGPHHYACSNCIAYWMRRLVEWPEAAMKVLGEMLREPTPASPQGDAAPIPMMLHCPKCHAQHIDAPEPEKGWENPPHKSHLCHACGTVWRPADVPTSGVVAIATRGSKDTWIAAAAQGDAAGEREALRGRVYAAMLPLGSLAEEPAQREEFCGCQAHVTDERFRLPAGGHVRGYHERVEARLVAVAYATADALAAAPLPAQPTPNVRPGCTSCDGDGCFFCAGAPATPAQPTPALEPVRAFVNAAVKRWANDTRDDRTVPRVVDDAFEEYALKAPPTPAQPTEEVRRLREQVDLDTLEKLLSKATPGPWRVDDLYTGGGSLTNHREAFCGGERWPVATVCASDDGILLPVAHCPGVPEGGPLQTLPTPGRDAANAALISALKAAAPALIAIARAALKEGS